MMLASRDFFQEWLLSGLFAIWPRCVKNSTDCCPSRMMSLCLKLQYVVLPEQSMRLFSPRGLSLDLLWRFFSVVRTPALVRSWVVPCSFHLVIMESCVILAFEKLFLYLYPQFLPKLYIEFPGGLGQTLTHGSLVNSHLQWI